MTFKEFRKEELGNIARTIFVSLITSFVVFFLIYFVKLRGIDNFMPKYGFYIFFAILSYSLIMPAIKQIKTHKEFPCMSGMMVGMTIGMIAGFLAGFFVGATNGMFYGSVWGMIVGIGLGIYSGRCCGIMGIMEGMMAGFMGGLMGAMTSLMMFNDNLKASGIIVFVVSAFIVLGLSYMIHKESKHLDKKQKVDEMFNIVLSFLLTTITIWLSVFGPRSSLFT